MIINSNIVEQMKTTLRTDGKSTYYYTILHEIGHILGIGSLWNYNNFLISNTYQGNTTLWYTKPNAIREYKLYLRKTIYNNVKYLPVEDDGGRGTEGGHIEEGITITGNTASYSVRYYNHNGINIPHPGLRSELMTGFADNTIPLPLSKITIGLLEDLGYRVDYSKAQYYDITITSLN